MAITLHPYKGYLNTLFQLTVTGDAPIDYRVGLSYNSDIIEILNGKVLPNEPFSFQMPLPGNFVVEFSDGSSTNLIVEDGYKFGGSKFKRAFIFDECLWAFIVMCDRTYFYNRDSKDAYVEPISPDEITAINEDYVIFKNDGHTECTVFSLKQQMPIICISDILYFNKHAIIWNEIEDESTIINIFYFESSERKRVKVDNFVVDESNERLIYSNNNTISMLPISNDVEQKVLFNIACGKVCDLVKPHLVISYEDLSYRHAILVYDVDSGKLIKRIDIPIYVHLAQVGDNVLIDLQQRRDALCGFDMHEIEEIPEAVISADYYSLIFYPCEWDVFYGIKHIKLYKSPNNRIKRDEEYSLHSCNTDLDIHTNSILNDYKILGDSVCIYNSRESFVENKNHSGSGYSYTEHSHVYSNEKGVWLYDDSTLYALNENGCWIKTLKGKLSFSEFDQFSVIKDNDLNIYQTVDGFVLGKSYCIHHMDKWNNYLPNIQTDTYYVFPDARKLKRTKNWLPKALSYSLKYGLDITSKGVFMWIYNGEDFDEIQILEDIFDTSTYNDVLLSDDGKFILYRDKNKTILMNIADATTTCYDNLSYIKDTNGMRTQFSYTPGSFQPRLVDPVTGQTVSSDRMAEYQFVSPDGLLYADTKIEKYVETWNLITDKLLSESELSDFAERFDYNIISSTPKYTKECNRRRYIIDNLEFFKTADIVYWVNRSTEESIKTLVDLPYHKFSELFMERRGFAFIRKKDDDSVVAKIGLGNPLLYLNYVSFSYDNRYVAIAGRYPNETNCGGLFLVYDLINQKIIINEKRSWAVWITSFNKQNRVAAYSSEPITYDAEMTDGADITNINSAKGFNFLTFSPDGCFAALSNQGYVSKYDGNGNERSNWGHQPSCDVYIVRSVDMRTHLEHFSDLSSEGISECKLGKTVASVSFSNDNKQLMMVGNDGVVVIRNLYFD